MADLELPEIETLRRDLERDVIGRKIKSVEVKSLKAMPDLRTKKAFTEPLVGVKIAGIDRVGTAILLHLSNEMVLSLRLGGAGRLERVASRVNAASDIDVTITFTQGGDLRIADDEGTNTIRLQTVAEFEAGQPQEGDGPLDLLTTPMSWIDFGRFVLRRTEPLKALLMDQTAFAGIGPIYSDEILFDAGLRYDRKANALTTQEVRRLYRSIAGTMHDAIKYRGTSIEKRPFNDLAGNPGEYGDHLNVYGKAGELSPRSRVPIAKATFKGKPVFFCTTQV